MRVYVPSTMSRLAALQATESLGEPPFEGYAVTDALRDWYGAGDEEEHEWAASEEAALASVRLLATEADAPRRRVVLPVDVPSADVQPDDSLGPAGVRIGSTVTLADVASVHVDPESSTALVTAAVLALAGAADLDDDPAGTPPALLALDEQALEWYATQELDDLLAGRATT